MSFGKLGAMGRGFGRMGSPLGSAGNSNAPSLRPISSRTFIPDQSGGASNTWVRTRTFHPTYRRNTGVLEVHVPNWFAGTGGSVIGGRVEVGMGAAATSEGLKVTYVDAVTGLQTTVALVDKTLGTAALAAADGADFIAVTPSPIDMAAAFRFQIDFAANYPSASGMPWRQWAADITNGDLFQFGSSQILLSATPTNSFAANLSWLGPSEILMVSQYDTVALLGDSRCASINDFANDQWGAIGNWGRLLQKRMPGSNVGVAGETAADFAVSSQNPRRRAIIARSNKRFNLLGINDLYFNSRSAAQVNTDNASIESSVGGTWYRGTLDPVINSGPTNTVNNAGGDARRQTYNNTYIRTKPHYYDQAATVESGSTGTAASLSYFTGGNNDGTHEANTGNEAPIGNASALDLIAAIGNPAQVPVVLPYALDSSNKSSVVTLSNTNLTASSSGSSPRPAVTGVRGATTGKYFSSIKLTGTQTVNEGFGVCMSTFAVGVDGESGTKAITAAGDGNAYGNSAQLGSGLGTWATNDVIDMAADLTNKLIWFRRNNGNWNNSGAANPATGVGGISISYLTGTILPLLVPWPNAIHTANFGLTAYTYAAPSGFSNWS